MLFILLFPSLLYHLNLLLSNKLHFRPTKTFIGQLVATCFTCLDLKLFYLLWKRMFLSHLYKQPKRINQIHITRF